MPLTAMLIRQIMTVLLVEVLPESIKALRFDKKCLDELGRQPSFGSVISAVGTLEACRLS